MVYRLNDRRGVSLLEVIVAFVILQMAAIIAVHMVTGATHETRLNRDLSVAMNLAQSKIEEVRQECLSSGKLKVGQDKGAFGVEGDFINDFSWKTETAEAGDPGLYSIKVEVNWGNEDRGRVESLVLASKVARRQ